MVTIGVDVDVDDDDVVDVDDDVVDDDDDVDDDGVADTRSSTPDVVVAPVRR